MIISFLLFTGKTSHFTNLYIRVEFRWQGYI